MKILAASIAAIALAASPAAAQNQPPAGTGQATTASTHHVRVTTKTTHVHGTMHGTAHHRTHHHTMRCGCPPRHYTMKTHHKVMHKTETTTPKTPG
jgi:hypothetical protein